METSDTPILAGFEQALPSSPPASLASQLPSPGSEEALAITVGSGRQCSMLLDLSSPLGRFSKILLESSLWTSSQEYCYVWNRLDTRFGLSAFQLMPLGQSTDGSECLLWRTPNASDVTGGPMDGERRLEQGHHLNLQEQAATPKLWPTPQAHDAAKGDPARVGRFGTKHGGRNLTDEVMVPKLWPTPTDKGNYNKAGLSEKSGNGLATAAKLWPTPTVPNGGRRNPKGTSITGKKPDGSKAQIDLREFAIRMWPTPTERDWKSTSHGNQNNARPLSEVAGLTGSGSLNPRFVEQLQGFPIDHTALKRSETRSSRNKPFRSSKRSPS